MRTGYLKYTVSKRNIGEIQASKWMSIKVRETTSTFRHHTKCIALIVVVASWVKFLINSLSKTLEILVWWEELQVHSIRISWLTFDWQICSCKWTHITRLISVSESTRWWMMDQASVAIEITVLKIRYMKMMTKWYKSNADPIRSSVTALLRMSRIIIWPKRNQPTLAEAPFIFQRICGTDSTSAI